MCFALLLPDVQRYSKDSKILGVTLDQMLSFRPLIKNLKTKVNARNNVINHMEPHGARSKNSCSQHMVPLGNPSSTMPPPSGPPVSAPQTGRICKPPRTQLSAPPSAVSRRAAWTTCTRRPSACRSNNTMTCCHNNFNCPP